MKTSILPIGALSILLISSLPTEARQPVKGSSGNKLIINKLFRGTGIKGKKSGEVLKDMREKSTSEEVQRLLPGKSPNGQADFNFSALRTVEIVPTLGKKEKQKTADILAKTGIKSEKQIIEVLDSNYKELNMQLKKIAEKIEKDPESVRKEDLEVMLEFATNLKDVIPAPPNLEDPVASNILRDIANNMHDMTSWEPAPRNNALKLMKDYNKNSKEGMHKVDALNDAFRTAENVVDIREVRKRQKEIRENCRK